MSREEIPDDIFQVAAEVAAAISDGMIGPEQVDPIARALMAERERCARIAQTYKATGSTYRVLIPGDIAASIRGGE